MNICISNEVIAMNLTVGIEIHQKAESMTVNSSTINDINAPVMNAKLATA